MEFDNIDLPPFVIAGLYKHSLVLIDGEITPSLKDGGSQIINNAQEINVETPSINTKLAVEKLEPTVKKPEHPTTPTKMNEQNTGSINFPVVEHPIATSAIKEPIAPVSNFKYLGGFGKKISIVLEDHFHPHINDGDLAFLTKLLQACQLSLNDVAIINVVSNQNFSNQLWQLMPAEKMIIFEVDPGTLGLPFRLSHFKLQPWSDCVFLASPSLEALQAGNSEKVVQLKRNLWESLKKMFLS